MRGLSLRSARAVQRALLVAAALGLVCGLGGCARWHYKPPIPTDYVGWRYTQHNYYRKFVAASSSSYRSGNYRVTVTTVHHSQGGGGRRVLYVPDICPPARVSSRTSSR